MKFLVPQQLESERLLLRQFQDADWPQLHRYFSDAQAMVFIQGRALSEAETWRVMCSMIGHWQIRGYGPYAVTDKTTDIVLGTVGFWYPNDWPEPEIKWVWRAATGARVMPPKRYDWSLLPVTSTSPS